MTLSQRDLKLLKALLEVGHRLERVWEHDPSGLAKFRDLIASLATEAESEDLRRLSFHSRNLASEMTTQHLATILVPFERLLGKAIRDDEFLVTEDDGGTRAVRPLTIVAENIRSAFNVGAIFRTAEAFGAEKVLLTGYTSTPEEERTAKTSMGTEKDIAWESLPRSHDAIEKLKQDGYTIIALETAEGAETLGEMAWPEKTALILGNERFGVDHETLAQVDRILRIPLHGRKNSLNVGIALGVALADWRRERPSSSIGLFRSPAIHPYEARRQGSENATEEIAYVELERGRGFEQALEDLEGFDRIWLLYEFHHNQNWKPKVMPPRGPRIKRGVFATRSPYRPNNIGMSCVQLVRIEGLKVFVKGFDLLDGTPILDLKPYLPSADAFPDSRAGWTEGLDALAFTVAVSEIARRQLAWLTHEGVTQIEGFARAQLEFDPTDEDRKRVRKLHEDCFELSYRTWRVDFRLDAETRLVEILRVRSGYTKEELLAPVDTYADKAVHKRYAVQNFD